MRLDVKRIKQSMTKNSGNCGPVCLQQIMAFQGDRESIDDIMGSVSLYDKNGTSFDGQLAHYLLKRRYDVKVYTRDTKIFDPSWFDLERGQLMKKLRHRKLFEKSKMNQYMLEGFINYLQSKGKIVFEPITKELIAGFLDQGLPVAVGVDDCLLYGFKRSHKTFYDDDLRGKVWGHEVVVAGHEKNQLLIVDPSEKNPFSKTGVYWHDADSLVANINSFGGYMIVAKKKKHW